MGRIWESQGGQHAGSEKYWPSGFLALVFFHEGREVSSDPAMPNRGLEWVDGAEVDNVFSESGTL